MSEIDWVDEIDTLKTMLGDDNVIVCDCVHQSSGLFIVSLNDYLPSSIPYDHELRDRNWIIISCWKHHRPPLTIEELKPKNYRGGNSYIIDYLKQSLSDSSESWMYMERGSYEPGYLHSSIFLPRSIVINEVNKNFVVFLWARDTFLPYEILLMIYKHYIGLFSHIGHFLQG